MRLHRDVDPESTCGGQVADGQTLFGTDYWCVYCGAKWSAEDEPNVRTTRELTYGPVTIPAGTEFVCHEMSGNAPVITYQGNLWVLPFGTFEAR